MKNLKKIIIYFFFVTANLIFNIPTAASTDQFPKLRKLEKEGVQISALVVRLSDKKIIAELNPDKRLSPASTSKLILAAKALETWGSNKTFTSQIYMRGHLENGVLNGDLIFYGAGDPSLTNEKIWFLASDVYRYGIKKVTGKLIVNNSFFGKIKEDGNRNAGKARSRNAYDAPLSSSAINFSVLAIVVNPAQKVGQSAIIALEPYAMENIKINGKIITTKENKNAQISVARSSNKGIDTFTISGSIPINSTAQRIYRSVSNPDFYAGETLKAFIKSSGVNISGKIVIESQSLLKNDRLIAEVDGFPLDWQLKGLFQVSNNFIADMLALNLLNDASPKNKGNLEESGKLLENYANIAVKESPWGEIINKNLPIVMESGSGLTPNNRLSARDIISVLDRMYFNGREFPAFLAALPIPGDEGTLKKRFQTSSEKFLQGRLRAKTGTLSEPVNVNALGGYSRLQNGEWISFAIIANGIKSKPQIEIKNLREAIDSDLARVLPPEL
ncbi:D-alanyl-D-alanine carboxypeptidase/D-alanyl-D-alanine endopeptidase [Fluviispira multicolorata]|uniref:D-alanyl-D-alanine carboxypeptidase/D-alanyl-D-alanine-endopeptidase n=1 Tax=Fluviispira multicolorata TaxID=2654512 RepID=A0A833N3P9_9BACT|nr:D-alanyl-D-alanine carboxypeptidase/D-alanyl-D-alanine-endopeptidase [Fluviispira multicolorata]KAB8030619.1 D-alanyl-D-alanine carboxypeptidase/D-alanyl-D-alanine-endopeptidase [Fluviispira multicolorata]